jgi:hypothetical protein
MQMEFVSQVPFRSNSIASKSNWSEELTLALGTRRHGWNLAFVQQDDEASALNWGTAQMRFKLFRGCFHPFPGWKREAKLAVHALQEAACRGH